MNKKSILIIGASSLLGRKFCQMYFSDYKIYSLGRTKVSSIHSHIDCDLSLELDYSSFPTNIDIVLYLAQSNNYKDFENYSKEIFLINTIRPLEIMEFYKKNHIAQFIYASTGGVYPFSLLKHHEDEQININDLDDFYFKSKISAELLLSSYSAYTNIAILRPFFIFGKNQKLGMLFPRLISNIKNKNSIKLNGSNGIKINPIYATDAARIINKIILENKIGIFNVAGNKNISLRKLCEIIGDKVGIKPIFEYSEENGYNVLADISKINFTNFTNLNLSIEEILQ